MMISLLRVSTISCLLSSSLVLVQSQVYNSANVIIFNLEGTGSITISCPSVGDTCSPNGAIGGLVGDWTTAGGQLTPRAADAGMTINEGSEFNLGGTFAPATTVTCSNNACACHLSDFSPCEMATATTMATPPAIGTTPGNGNGNVFEEGPPGSELVREEIDDGWQGCINPDNPDRDEYVYKGSRTTVCLVLANGANWGRGVVYLRLSFRPEADEYSRLHIPDSYRDLVTGSSAVSGENTNITVHVASQRVLSFQKIYQTPMDRIGKVYPYLTAIIDVRDGIVQGILWDDACIFCDRSLCDENTFDFNGQLGTHTEFDQNTRSCYISEEQCNRYIADSRTDCDIILYVVWTGTDRDGNTLQSYETRFSAFESRELQDRLLDNVPDLPSNLFN